jgi:hypothetical protein
MNKTQAPIEVNTSPLGLAMQRIGLQIGRDTGTNLSYLIQPREPVDVTSTFGDKSMTTKSIKSKVKKQKASMVSNRSNLSSNRRTSKQISKSANKS